MQKTNNFHIIEKKRVEMMFFSTKITNFDKSLITHWSKSY